MSATRRTAGTFQLKCAAELDVARIGRVGLVEKTEQGRVHVPLEVIEADFELRAA